MKMARETYSLLGEVYGQQYRDLLRISVQYSDRFLLVLRSNLELNEEGHNALEMLSPFILNSEERAEWPGTRLLVGTAAVNKYRLNQDSLGLLLKLSQNLYDWKQPNLPEDLGLLRSDDSPFLGSIAHEKDAFLTLDSEEHRTLVREMPGLNISAAF
jgi:hypothetical protein